MIKRRLVPACIGMALVALVSEPAIMPVIHFVAADTFFLDLDFVWVLFVAIYAL